MIGDSAFSFCTNLRSAVFLGNQPDTFGTHVFENVKTGFLITVTPTSIGFGKPVPYNNEISWIWKPNKNSLYNVVSSI